jgi:exosortase A-associated hydrolase 2
MTGGPPPAEPFFLDTGHGQRYCLYHAPAEARGALLYVHPFAEEMNRTRRAAALQARELAARGIAVLQVDLYGCGDSSGEFADARWSLWLQDLAHAHAWLAERSGGPVGLWGVRLGALLALDYAAALASPPARLLLWQPVLRGSTFLAQFLRLRAAGELLGSGAASSGIGELRAALAAGETLEIGGYELGAALAAGIDAANALALPAPGAPVDWFEVVGAPDRPAPPAALELAGRWRGAGAEVTLAAVPDLPFWSTQEVSACPALRAATAACFGGAHG